MTSTMQKAVRATLPRSWGPVSYTHLDVYKRQELVVRENNESCEMLDLPVRVTIILRAEQGCLLLSQLHLSLPSPCLLYTSNQCPVEP